MLSQSFPGSLSMGFAFSSAKERMLLAPRKTESRRSWLIFNKVVFEAALSSCYFSAWWSAPVFLCFCFEIVIAYGVFYPVQWRVFWRMWSVYWWCRIEWLKCFVVLSSRLGHVFDGTLVSRWPSPGILCISKHVSLVEGMFRHTDFALKFLLTWYLWSHLLVFSNWFLNLHSLWNAPQPASVKFLGR